MLEGKTIHELRSIAEGYNIPDVFSKDVGGLIKAITVKQLSLVKQPKIDPPHRPEYDSSIMLKRPSKVTEQARALELLKGHIDRGLEITFPQPDQWHMRYKSREDTGSLRIPPRVILNCADDLLK